MLSVLVLMLFAAPGLGQYFGSYNCEPGRDVMVHLFQWKHSDVAAECENFLAGAGYCAVQISPPAEHIVHDGTPWRPWWEDYQPISYRLSSRRGTEAELTDMIQRCNNVGIRVYADVLMNHMTGDGEGTGTGGGYWTTGGTLEGDESYPEVPYSGLDFNGADNCPTSDLGINDWNDPIQVRNCRLVGLRDLRLANDYPRGKVQDYMNSLVAIGIAGFRLDAAKHMWPGDMQAIFAGLNDLNTNWFPPGTRPFIFQEVIGDWWPDYNGMGRVTEFNYGEKLSEVFKKLNGQQLSYLQNFGEGWNFMPGLDAVAFVDNHDNQRGHGGAEDVLTHKEAFLYKMAVGYMLAWDYGYIRVMSSYSFTDADASPPANGDGSVRDVVCFDGDWMCEHKWRQVYNMVTFHNLAVGTAVTNWWDNGFDGIAFSRQGVGFVAINNDVVDLNADIAVDIPDGDYCDVISCDGPTPPCGNSGGYCRGTYTVAGGRINLFLSNVVGDMNNEIPMIALHV